MKVEVKVIPGAQKNYIKGDGELLRIYLTSPAVDGRANKALIEFLANHFNVRKSQIEIVQGLRSRNKIIRINDN